MIYRREIDGLRGIAVLSVVFFHAGFSSFSGGFVGVDVFFVISGYLITSIIIEQKKRNQFKLFHFYERRIRRVFPALFVVIAFCIPLSWLLMLPNEYRDFGQSLVATSLFSSNILFSIESGYFSQISELKPLLHTWSLSIEEQYYLVFPVFVILAWRFGVKFIFVVLFIVSVLSLIFAELVSIFQPKYSFYSLMTRCWEILAGALLSLSIIKLDYVKSNVIIKELLSIAGLIMVLLSMILFDESTPFPSLWTLIPVIGVVFIILCAEGNTFVGRLLSTKLLVGIGLISYGLYLWHQPFFAFVRLQTIVSHPQAMIVLAIIMSVIFSFLSWKYIETLFRKKDSAISRGVVFKLAAFCIVITTFYGFYVHHNDGFINSFDEHILHKNDEQMLLLGKSWQTKKLMMHDGGLCNFSSTKVDKNFIEKFQRCQKPKVILVIGDSHSMNIFNILSYSELFQSHSIIGINRSGSRPDYIGNLDYIETLQFIEDNRARIDQVIYHQSGSS
jgi:peptidoglycan/LPS O-acetylase OafA/YrhL